MDHRKSLSTNEIRVPASVVNFFKPLYVFIGVELVCTGLMDTALMSTGEQAMQETLKSRGLAR